MAIGKLRGYARTSWLWSARMVAMFKLWWLVVRTLRSGSSSHLAGEKMDQYSFCESVHAGSHSRWHIRKLTERGHKYSGGIDSPSLCGRLTAKISGWDINVAIRRENLSRACPECERAYFKELEDGPQAKMP